MSKKQTREMLKQLMMSFVAKGGKVTKIDTMRTKRTKYGHKTAATTTETVDMNQIPAELKAKLGLE